MSWDTVLCCVKSLKSCPGDLPDPGIEASSLTSPALAGGTLPLAPPGKPLWNTTQQRRATTETIDMTYMDFKSIMLSGIKSQYQKIIYCMTPYIQSAHNDKIMEIENTLVIVRV